MSMSAEDLRQHPAASEIKAELSAQDQARGRVAAGEADSWVRDEVRTGHLPGASPGTRRRLGRRFRGIRLNHLLGAHA